MNILTALNLACPIDGEVLVLSEKQLRCKNGHTFDIARQGYVNLLPVQHKRSKQPGDSKAMVKARFQFLNTGIYQPVAEKLTTIVCSQIDTDKDICFLDAGCGEGYYSDFLLDAINKNDGAGKLTFIGLDISKEAIIQATKRNKQISWIVGTNRQPPVEEYSVDVVLCLFGFLSFEGFNKILKPGGKIILVDPGPEHLQELREIIYPEVKKQKQDDSSPAESAGFSLIHCETLKFFTKVSGKEQINNLLIMTPHFYRASKDGRDVACGLAELDITVNVVYSVLQKL